MNPIEIISYNVNGIRAAIRKGFLEWLAQNPFDIVCLQETKATPEQVDVKEFEKLGYNHYWVSADKKGYSGVAVFSRIEPDDVCYGCGIEDYDKEGRVLRLDFGKISLVNTYFPSGSSGEHRQSVKMRFLKDYNRFIHELKAKRPNLIVCGDYNICHMPIDIHDPVRNKKSSGFLPEERAWLTGFFDGGMIDTFRHFNKQPHHYTWWSNFAGARNKNKGWRIDYISVTKPLQDKLLDAAIMPHVVHSDHCPVYLKMAF